MRKFYESPVMFASILAFVLVLSACSTVKKPKAPSESKIAHDLIGHTTGGRESSWLFREGQIKNLEVLSSKGDVVVVALIAHVSETNEDFIMVVEVHYHYCLTNCHTRIESVGLRWIRKL